MMLAWIRHEVTLVYSDISKWPNCTANCKCHTTALGVWANLFANLHRSVALPLNKTPSKLLQEGNICLTLLFFLPLYSWLRISKDCQIIFDYRSTYIYFSFSSTCQQSATPVVSSYHITSTITARYVSTSAVATLVNEDDVPGEASFTFQMTPGAFITEFIM